MSADRTAQELYEIFSRGGHHQTEWMAIPEEDKRRWRALAHTVETRISIEKKRTLDGLDDTCEPWTKLGHALPEETLSLMGEELKSPRASTQGHKATIKGARILFDEVVRLKREIADPDTMRYYEALKEKLGATKKNISWTFRKTEALAPPKGEPQTWDVEVFVGPNENARVRVGTINLTEDQARDFTRRFL